MSMGSSPFAFAEFADATLRLPDSLREYLRWPMGLLVHGEAILPAIGRASPVVTVGDFCTLDLVARGRSPDVCLVDFKTKRQEDRGLVQGDPQGRTDPDPGRAPGVPREGTEGDEGHRRDRFPGLHVRSVRAGRVREGLQNEGRGPRGRAQAHLGPQQADRAGGQERGRAETGETRAGSEGGETGGGAQAGGAETRGEARTEGGEAAGER